MKAMRLKLTPVKFKKVKFVPYKTTQQKVHEGLSGLWGSMMVGYAMYVEFNKVAKMFNQINPNLFPHLNSNTSPNVSGQLKT